MLRELSIVLLELQEAMLPLSAGLGQNIHLHGASLSLPMDLRVELGEGEVQLLADVPRSLSDLNWRAGVSRLSLTLYALPAQVSA